MLIATGTLSRQALGGKTAIVTGAGGGIGFEAARALAWLGARVIIAEIDAPAGQAAAASINSQFGTRTAFFIQTDVGYEHSIERLASEAALLAGQVDIILNNATIAPLGAVKDVSIDDWDRSYRVNLRGPVLLARTFLPGMLARNTGVFVCVSSTGTAYLGAYETFKAAQVHLANTLDAELEGTGVAAFTIGPGLVPTQTAQAAVERLAPQMGLSIPEFYKLNAGAVLSVEEAGAGFGAAIALADQFRGQEISSMQALKAAGIQVGEAGEHAQAAPAVGQPNEQALVLCHQVRNSWAEQSEGWKHRSLFERQWVIRDFRKTAGMPAEEWLTGLSRLEAGLAKGEGAVLRLPFDKLAGYYRHLAEMAKGYERDPAKLAESLRQVNTWKDEVERLAELMPGRE